MPLARGYFERFLGWFCLPFREVGTGRGSGSTSAYASHDALRDAGVLLCFFGQFDLWSFQQRTTKSGRPARSWLAGPGERGREYHFMWASTVTIAVYHMSLAAMAEGLGTCWIGASKRTKLRRSWVYQKISGWS